MGAPFLVREERGQASHHRSGLWLELRRPKPARDVREKDVALELTGGILKAAQGADCIITVCPMCQMNLEAYQDTISKSQGEELDISVLYLPQLMGLAFGLPDEDLKLNLNLALTKPFREKLGI